jgi:hypothetical protein
VFAPHPSNPFTDSSIRGTFKTATGNKQWFEWWKTQPRDELMNNGNNCLATLGEIYAVYLPRGGNVTVRMQPGQYVAAWWNPTTGEKAALPLRQCHGIFVEFAAGDRD